MVCRDGRKNSRLKLVVAKFLTRYKKTLSDKTDFRVIFFIPFLELTFDKIILINYIKSFKLLIF